jgi:hypothetical protein
MLAEQDLAEHLDEIREYVCGYCPEEEPRGELAQ